LMSLPSEFEQCGPEGKRLESSPSPSYLRSPDSLIFFGNRICPFAHRSWWSALEKGVEKFDYIHIDLGPSKPKWYAAEINESGTVPCLFDNGKPVFESMIVSEYLEDKYKGSGTSLLPSDPYLRAEIRFLITFWSEKVQRPLYALLMNQDRSTDDEMKTNLSKLLKSLNDRFVAQSAGPYFLGKEISLADIAVVPFLERFVSTLKHYRNFDVFGPDTARLQELTEACRKRPAFQRTTQTPEFFNQGYASYANPKK